MAIPAVTAVVATAAASLGHDHMRTLAKWERESWKLSLIPSAIDGMVIAASTVLLARRRAGLAGGVLVSLAANAAAAQSTLVGRAIALVPPLALALSFELVRSLVCASSQPSSVRAPITHHDIGELTNHHQPRWSSAPPK